MQIFLIGAAAGLTAQGINTSCVHAAAPTHVPRITFRWMKSQPLWARCSHGGNCKGELKPVYAGDAAQAAGVQPVEENVPGLSCSKLALSSGSRASLQHIRVWPMFAVEKTTFHLDFILLNPVCIFYLCIFCNWQNVLYSFRIGTRMIPGKTALLC